MKIRIYDYMERGEFLNRRNFWSTILLMYIILLLVFVVIKIDGPIYLLKERIDTIRKNRLMGYWNYNFVLFKNTLHYIRNISERYAYLNIFGNIFPFIPLGALIPTRFEKFQSFPKTIITCFGCIVVIEIFQFLTLLGYFDVDDIILNSIGCILGYGIFVIFRYIKR